MAPTDSLPPLTRRHFLVGVVAAGALAACGSSEGSGADGATSATSGVPTQPVGDGRYVLVQRFPQNVQEVGPQRLPMSLATSDGTLLQDGPATLAAQVTSQDGTPLGDPITATRRDVSPGAYYDFRTEIDEEGFYFLVVDGGPAEGAAFQVMAPGTVGVAGPGDQLPPFDTPTVDDARGVGTICTRTPEPCPFHDVTLTEALESAKGVVYLIGTPAFCQTGTCAPALESIIDIADEYADEYVFVHAEVYDDDTATVAAPAVDAAGLTYEPVVFITDANGTIVERLDAVWNGDELVEILERN